MRLETTFKEKKELTGKDKSRKNKYGVVEKTSGLMKKTRKGEVLIRKVDDSMKKKKLAFLV